MSLTVGIYLFDEVEVLDFAGPFEVFSTASRVHARLYPDARKPFHVITIGPEAHTVVARGGLHVEPDYAIGSHPPLDVLIIPGGVVTAQLDDQRVIDWIAAHAARDSTITASVCTGAFLLSKAGLLRGKSATTHWEDIADLRAMFPGVKVQDNQLFFWEGNPISEYPFLPWFISTVAGAFIYTWLYNSTKGSLMLVALFYIALNTFGVVISSVSIIALAILYVLVALVLVVTFGGTNLSRRKRVCAG